MSIQNALLITSALVTLFGLFAIFMIKEEPGYRKAKPYFIIFYLLNFALYYLASTIPDYQTRDELYLLVLILTLSTAMLTVGITVRCRRPELEKATYAVTSIFVLSLLSGEFVELAETIFTIANVLIVLIAIVKKQPKANVADYGLVAILFIWSLFSIVEAQFINDLSSTTEYFNSFMVIELLVVPANIFGVTIFIVTSYMMDSYVILERVAKLDPLTELLNRRALFERIAIQEN
ncbi:hypothetical protein [Vibrio sp. HN007]|uniref:hypothetical protein n=1 Tax=Vibrio iocasae TaxID=3098914 RepID=UPI0035D43511